MKNSSQEKRNNLRVSTNNSKKILLPNSESEEVKPYIISPNNRIAIFGDIHAPYHSVEAIKWAVKETKKLSPTILLINGDLSDFYQISKFLTDPDKMDLKSEIRIATQLLQYFKKELPNTKIIYKAGNHCDRLRKYIIRSAPELSGITDCSLQQIFQLKRFNIDFVPEHQIIHCGSMSLIHGHEIGNICVQYAAKKLYDLAKVNCIASHTHRPSEYTARNLRGDIIRTYITPALCSLKPEFRRQNDWQNGFGFLIVKKDGKFEYQNRIMEL